MTVEEWREVPGHDGYEASSLGRIRSIDRVSEYERVDQYSGRVLKIRRKHKGRILRPASTQSGHQMVVLGRGKNASVHTLVLLAFVGPAPEGHEALHRNDVAHDNRLKNLRWGTRSENYWDAVRNGKAAIGERHPASKLKRADIPKIMSMKGRSASSVARKFGVTAGTIRQVWDGKTWRIGADG